MGRKFGKRKEVTMTRLISEGERWDQVIHEIGVIIKKDMHAQILVIVVWWHIYVCVCLYMIKYMM